MLYKNVYWTYSWMIIVVKVHKVCNFALKKDYEFINTVPKGTEETHSQVIVNNFMLITN